MSLFSLSGKTALITGSTGGIGLGIATQLAKAGCQIGLHGLEPLAEITPLLSNLKSLSGNSGQIPFYSNANLSTEQGCKDLVQEATSAMGKLDIVCNNAGVQFTSPVEKFPTDQWNLVIALNLSAPFFISRQVLPQMQARGFGRLIHIGSAHSIVASQNKAAYVAAKHGLAGLSKVIALESAKNFKGVTSNTVCPGWVLTNLVQQQIDRIAKEKGIDGEKAKRLLLEEKQPSGEFIRPEDLGDLVLFLCTDAGNGVNGANFVMDGGWTAQ